MSGKLKDYGVVKRLVPIPAIPGFWVGEIKPLKDLDQSDHK
jgi:hypothetical protein